MDRDGLQRSPLRDLTTHGSIQHQVGLTVDIKGDKVETGLRLRIIQIESAVFSAEIRQIEQYRAIRGLRDVHALSAQNIRASGETAGNRGPLRYGLHIHGNAVDLKGDQVIAGRRIGRGIAAIELSSIEELVELSSAAARVMVTV